MQSIPQSLIGPRLERIPLMPWHWRAVGIVGIALSAETVDSLALSFALPVLIERWSLSTVQAGLLISMTYAGQMVGAALCGWLSDLNGRLNLLRWATGAVILLGFLVAWSNDYSWFLLFRTLQGVAMGGVLVLTITYISEIAATSFRGRLIFGLNVINGCAASTAAIMASQIIPLLGVQWIFYIGAIISVPFFILSWKLPESPRWLDCEGRKAEAERIVSTIEERAAILGELPVPELSGAPVEERRSAGWRDLMSKDLARMTLCIWVMAVSCGTISVSLLGWLPIFFLKSYTISLEAALFLSSVSYLGPTVAAIGGLLFIDRISREISLIAGFAGLAVLLLTLWSFLGDVPILVGGGLAFLTVLVNMFVMQTILLISTERYPTALRGSGAGAARFWMSVSAIVAPLVGGMIMENLTVKAVLVFMAAAGLVGLLTTFASAHLRSASR